MSTKRGVHLREMYVFIERVHIREVSELERSV